uniref:Chemosensory protein n=1 Tax=Histia rhodope TaxID=1453155 RepID=A0A6M9BQC7_9NEOP|nr:chemosensory protein [Histia rhodope]
MKTILVLFALLGSTIAQTYTPTNDDFNIEALLSDIDALKGFINCFLDKGNCDAIAADFKNELQEAINDGCSKCTPAQKHIFKRFLEGGNEKLPSYIQEFKNKYDPDGSHFSKLEKALENA